ncbi:MAG TPA: GH116 family glycosyl hydrolase, partial [Bacteroidales bacterium]|nr:GH116 family glycosyl hydrolase [Bacteroidales bacterium]
GGFILSQACLPGKPWYRGDFAIWTDEPSAVIDYCWFRGGWFDARTLLWKDIRAGNTPSRPVSRGAEGASIYIPLTLTPGGSKTIRIMLAWYVPHSDQRFGWSPYNETFREKVKSATCDTGPSCCPPEITSGFYEPWYAGRFSNIGEVTAYWSAQYEALKHQSELFSETFFTSDLPPEVLEAISANLSILKSPTVLRQKDGRLWGWEGCFDKGQGCCEGSCTHVWNYAQAISRLFPALERTLRETEFRVSQNDLGHQNFRSALPIREPDHGWHAASDGQLGGIMKVYREWRISGDTRWMENLWPRVRKSLDYCIENWDPKHKGVIEEPHHNTYDIEFWGPDGMITGFYVAALHAAIQMGSYLKDDVKLYRELYAKGKRYLETELFNGRYFFQRITTEGLRAENPVTASRNSIGGSYSDEAMALLVKEGPKYQYGNGCLSDGVLGIWLSEMCGLDPGIDRQKVKSHLLSVYRYNFKTDLSLHANPQRAAYAYGKEGGLLLCTWPEGGELSLPFVYSNEVWTGIEYQVASHLMRMGEVEKGLEIVKAARRRYDGTVRNPFDEYECGHWYARAMSSYGLLQGLTGIFLDAVTGTMYIDSKIGDNFSCFFACETGFGKAGLRNGKPFAEAVSGTIPVRQFYVSGRIIKP